MSFDGRDYACVGNWGCFDAEGVEDCDELLLCFVFDEAELRLLVEFAAGFDYPVLDGGHGWVRGIYELHISVLIGFIMWVSKRFSSSMCRNDSEDGCY